MNINVIDKNSIQRALLIVFATLALSINTTSAQARHNTIADIITDANGFDVLQFALETAGLVDLLDGRQRYTIFAPTDEAFQELADALTGGDVLALATALVEADLLDDVLAYHVTNYRLSGRYILQRGTLHTLSGQTLTTGIGNDGLYVQGINNETPSNIIRGFSARNGKIFAIDQVLINIDPADL